MSNWKEANFGFQEFAVRFQFIPNKKGSTNSVSEISKTFELSEQRHVRKSKNFIGLAVHADQFRPSFTIHEFKPKLREGESKGTYKSLSLCGQSGMMMVAGRAEGK
ncbi:unnamed protein product [Malus baccata var. baccata]